METKEDLMLVLSSGVCETCGEAGQALYHSRLSRGPLACADCWQKRLAEVSKPEEVEHETATE